MNLLDLIKFIISDIGPMGSILPIFVIGIVGGEPIDTVVVRLEADVRAFMEDTEKAIRRLKRDLDGLDKTTKRVSRMQRLRDGLKKLATALRQAQIAAVALGAALVLAFKMAQKAIEQIRIERSFFRLAAAAGQSGREIVAAMERASRGAIDRITLMQKANLALQLGVSKTPEEFEKLARSAIALGAAMGLGPVQSLDDLIVAAGRRTPMILDNLGIQLADVNRLMEEFAQQDFGKSRDQLTQVQRNMLFTRATIEAANDKAAQLGGNLEDAGGEIERMVAQTTNFKTEMNKTSLVLVTLLLNMGEGGGLLERLTRGAVAWQTTLVQIAAIFMAINDTMDKIDIKIRDLTFKNLVGPPGLVGKLMRGEKIAPEDLMPGFFKIPRKMGEAVGDAITTMVTGAKEGGDGAGESFSESFTRHLDELQTQFQDILDPEAGAEGAVMPGPTFDEDETDESAEEIRDIVDSLTTDLLNAVQDQQDSLEESEKQHIERMEDIAEEGARKRKDIADDLRQDLEDLAHDTADSRAEIFQDAQRDLEKIARDTDEALEDEREDFQEDERRATEDHLRDMRRLTEDYLLDLEDAVTARDARAVVDLQRRFRSEQQRREEDFGTRQGRERDDQDERLAEIRENEARRRRDILEAQAQQLQDLITDERRSRQEIQDSHAEQLADLDESLARQRKRENDNYADRQSDLDDALKQRLEAIADELADEEDLNDEAARRILEVLDDTFGVGGEIDKLMEDFAARRRQRMIVEVTFEPIEPRPATYGLPAVGGGRLPPGVSFQHGGSMIARKPTVALFGEAGPELAQFLPLNQARGQGDMAPQRLEIEFSGSAPPGIRAAERDQIAGVLLNALKDTGQVQR